MNINNKTFISSIIFLSFVAAVFLGLHSMTPMDGSGKMPNCPLAVQFEESCPMSVADHVAAWEQLFIAIPQQNVLSKLLLIFAAFTFLFLSPRYRCFLLFQKPAPFFQKNYILDALSHGVLRKRE